MIVAVHREEIIGLLSQHFGTAVKDFVITSDSQSIVGKACRAGVTNPLDNNVKISNIKALRNVAVMIGSPMTLMEGKYALEHWIKWIAFVDEHNRMPKGGYGSGDGYGKLK
jgi:hypothetical protein